MSDWYALNHELLPCPFCGGKACLARYISDDGEEIAAECENIECLMSVHGALTPEEAVKRWNRRVDITGLKACPFCGSEAEIVKHEAEDESEVDMYEVKCRNPQCCAETVTSSDIKDVIPIWDRRHD